MKKWTSRDNLSQKGKTFVITGGTSGIGYEDALALVQAEATVVITGRDAAKGAKTLESIRAVCKNADIHFEILDLADLQSVASFADRIVSRLPRLDVLINNAGVMTPPQRRETNDGYELQFGANYLGHFALTHHLLQLLSKSHGRVISLSSIVARNGAIDFDDLQAVKEYVPMRSYSQSKIACLMFAFELQRRSDENGWNITSIAAHPGVAKTNLLVDKGVKGYTDIMRRYTPFMFQPPAQGALPSLFAAVAPEASPGAYYCPDGFLELRGYPALARTPVQALDAKTATKLWDVSKKLIASK